MSGNNHHNHRPAAPAANKVLVIGLDGATFDLIRPWAANGDLPALARVMEQGAYGELRSTTPPMTAPAWTSFATGVNPGQHRLYDWIAREPGSYRFTPTTALDARSPAIYQLLSECGRRVCSLNVPMTYPATPVNGVMVSGMPAPSLKASVVYPESLLEAILENVGDYILYPDPGQAYSDSGIDQFLQRLYRCTELRVSTLQYLRQLEPWDFTMVVFNGTDTISHAMWKFMDRSHPLHDPTRYEKYGQAIHDYYQTVDAHVGQLLDEVDDQTTVIIMSDHGFGPFHKFIHVNNWLIREGFMAVRKGPASQTKKALFHAGFSPMNVYDMLMRFGFGALKREVVRGQGQGLLKTLFLSFADVDWSRTQCYSLGNVGQIYVNVAGREPAGCVQPGDEYERVRDTVIDRLWQLRDPATGEQVVEKVFRREEIYSGPELDKAPDIVFIPTRLEYFGFGEYEFGSHKIVEAMRRGISGTHRMNGIFLAYGPDIRPGLQVDGAQIIDLAPTILHLMGEPVPSHMDGRVLTEILPETYRPVEISDYDGRQPIAESAGDELLTAEERQILTERLRDLGYVG